MAVRARARALARLWQRAAGEENFSSKKPHFNKIPKVLHQNALQKLRASRAKAEFLCSRVGFMLGVGLLLLDLRLAAASSRKAARFARIVARAVARTSARPYAMLS